MDVHSIYKEDGPLFEEEVNLKLLEDKDEQGGKGFEGESKLLDKSIQISGNKELPAFQGAINEGNPLPSGKSDSAGALSTSEKAEEQEQPFPDVSDLDADRQGKNLLCNSETLGSAVEDYEYHNGKEEPNHAVPSGELLLNCVDEVSKDETELEDSDACLNGHSDCENRKSTLHQLVDEASTLANSSSEKAELYNAEFDSRNIGHRTVTKEDEHMMEMIPSDNGEVVRESSTVHSPQNRQSSSLADLQSSDILGSSHENIPFVRQEQMLLEINHENLASPPDSKFSPEMEREGSVQSPATGLKGASSPSPEKQLSVSLERSFDNKSFAGEDHPTSEKIDRESGRSTKHTLSPEKRTIGRKRAASRDRLSPPLRHKSPSGRITHRDAHHNDHSSKKRLSSPKGRESPRRRDRSVSRSPVRRKDSSTYRRDRRERSRSTSPNRRDHYRRSPRRRYSPRRRSPPSIYHSRHRSPRRPWSPPPNRNTGVGRPGRNLFVAGFSYVTTERDLEKKFSRFGHVTDVRIVRDKRSGESRGFGFLSLERDEDADAAIRALDQTEWNGRIVLVEKSKTSAR